MISSAYVETCPVTTELGNSIPGQTCPLMPKSPDQMLQSEGIEKRRQGATMPDRPFDLERL